MSDNPYSEDVIPIDRIEFDVWSNSEVKDYSVIKSPSEPFGIILAETYDNYEPKRGGIVDLRLGTTDNQRVCATCGERDKNCPGHFGHTEFAEPVFNFAFKDGVKNILGCICLRCSNLRISRTQETLEHILKYKNGKNRFTEIRKIAKLSNCQVCNAPIPSIKLEIKNTTGVIQFIAETNVADGGEGDTEQAPGDNKKKVREVLTPKMVYEILVNISDADWKLMGFDQHNQRRFRPEDLIIKNFPIPPVAIRPSVKADFLTTGTSEDTLNNKLADIIKASQRLRKYTEKENPTEEERKYLIDFLKCQQYNVAVYYDNDTNLPKSAQKSCGRPVKSISERLRGKTGLVRNNLMGKRVNYCARSVITSDPNLSLDELGVPIKIAMNLTVIEVVTPFNYDRLMKLVRNGRYNYPGANMVRVRRGDRYTDIDLRYNKGTVNLNMGDEVWRHLQPGDPVLFNRQPTLHKMSMMTHRVKVINNDKLSTFRLNVTATAPYGADPIEVRNR